MRKTLLCSAIALLAAGCGDGGTSAPVATSVTVAPGSLSLDALGATQVVRASVTDQKGRPMAGAALSWSSNSAAVSVVGAGGDSAVVTAVGNGPAVITAASGSASGTAIAQVAQTASSVQEAGGNGQTGPVGAALPQPLRVVVRDRLNAPVAGVPVSFTVDGGGAVSAASGVSGADGTVSVTWTLGTSAGSNTQRVAASAAGVGLVIFMVTAVAGPPSAAAVAGGDGQTAARGTAVAVAPRVWVTDAFGNAVSGAAVHFAATAGGGSVAGSSQTTDFTGLAVVDGWTLGASAGPNRVSSVTVLESTHREFAEAAARVVRSMRFHPARLDGERVAVRVEIPINFELSTAAFPLDGAGDFPPDEPRARTPGGP